MDDLVAAINAALRKRGWSARHASVEAVGNEEFIRNLRRGSAPAIDRFRALCDVLDLEFYVGPRRQYASVDERRLEVAVETTERALESTAVALAPAEKARAFVAIYELIGEEETPANAERIERLLQVISGGRNQPERKDSNR